MTALLVDEESTEGGLLRRLSGVQRGAGVATTNERLYYTWMAGIDLRMAGHVTSLKQGIVDTGARLVVGPRGCGHRPAEGDSISVSGCCLTVARGSDPARGRIAFDVIPETLGKTILGDLKPGSRVNLEHAVRADTLMGGHFVQGHIDGVGAVRRVQADEADWRIEIGAPAELMDCIIPKGSIALDGVSLTIAEVFKDGFGVALIPTTLELTTLGALKAGSRCNIETDMIARQVAWVVKGMGTRQ